MKGEGPNSQDSRQSSRVLPEYSGARALVSNLPYMAMILLGTAVVAVGFGGSLRGWFGAGAYLLYGVAGVLWIIMFLCPYCPHWNTRTCPCGYGRIAAKLRSKRDSGRFREKFRRHIPAIVPLWFIPILAGILRILADFSWPLLVLLVIFAVDAFVVLPLFSAKHGCVDCPQADSCPWMAGRR
jgi:hypothetical protein